MFPREMQIGACPVKYPMLTARLTCWIDTEPAAERA